MQILISLKRVVLGILITEKDLVKVENAKLFIKENPEMKYEILNKIREHYGLGQLDENGESEYNEIDLEQEELDI